MTMNDNQFKHILINIRKSEQKEEDANKANKRNI